MATEKELQDEMERLRAEVQGLAAQVEEAKTGLQAFGKASAQGAKDVAKGLGSFAVNVGKGDTSFKSLNSVVDIASNALSGMAKAIPYAGEALAAGIKATAEASKFMLEQLDQTTKAFNDLGKVGALTEAGMTGLQKQFLASGLTLGTFTKQIGDNAQALARFQGMAGDGADAFSDIAGRLTRGSDDSLRRLGMSADQIGESTAAYVTQQTRLGLAQGRSNAELAAGTKAYAIELDALQKVTGLSREAIQKQQDAALSEARFRANYDDLIAQGKEKEAKQLMKLQTQISAIGPEAGQGVRDLLSGAGTDAAKKLMASTGGAAQQILDRVKSGQIDSTQAAIELQNAMRGSANAARNNAKYVDKNSSAYLDYSQQSDIVNAKIINGELVRDRQNKQMTKGQDTLTDTTVDAEKAMQGMNIEMQRLGFTFLPQASKAVDAMTKSMNKFINFVNEKIGGGPGKGTDAQNEAAQNQQVANTAAGVIAYDEFGNPVMNMGPSGPAGNKVAGTDKSRASAEQYLGKKITDDEFSALIKATHAEAAGGKEASQQEQAMIMASILNRARDDKNGIMGALYAKNQFQSVTGTKNNNYQPSQAFVTGPTGQRLESIENSATLLAGISKDQKNFTAANAAAYGAGTNIGYRDKMLANGGVVIGGTVFQSGAPSGPSASATPNSPPLAGPSAPYQPTTAAVQPSQQLPSNTPPAPNAPPIGTGTDNAILVAQLAKQDEIISLLRNMLGVETKLLQRAA
jgi:hypothetical protein